MNWVGMFLLQDSFRGADFLGVFRMAKGVHYWMKTCENAVKNM